MGGLSFSPKTEITDKPIKRTAWITEDMMIRILHPLNESVPRR